ncbi:GatB/YqeY domain-containing protein, partial [Candidatus Daviesbacteria bacterium]|nr:GatB/YqeY domain-containing protein [Candidatus Daviesbacteria bacterium]
LRLLLSEVHNLEIQKGGQISDQDIILVIQREVKKRTEAATGFRQGGREQSAQKEEAELKVLQTYLPVQPSNEELTKVVEESINEVGAKSMADMGKVMGVVMGKVKGQTDGNVVSGIVKEKLTTKV